MPQITHQDSQHQPKEEKFIVMASRSQRPKETLPKLRQACDMCHHAKVKCSDAEPCVRCRDNNLHCSYSYAIKPGKPKGSKNRKTLEKLEQIRLEAEKAMTTVSPASQDPRTVGGKRKRARVPQDEYCSERQTLRMRRFDAGLTPPLTDHDLESTGNNADPIFHVDFADFPDLPMDINLEISPPSTKADDDFDMEEFCCIDTMHMNSAFDSLVSSSSVTKPVEIAHVGSSTPDLQESRTPSGSPPSFGLLRANLFDVTMPCELAMGKSETTFLTQCFCGSQQAFQLSKLYCLSAQTDSPRLNMFLQCVNDTLGAVDSFLRCSQCSKDSTSLLVSIATTQLVYCEIQKLLSYSSNMASSIGEYRPTQDDEPALKRLVIERAVRKGRNTMRELRQVMGGLGSTIQNHHSQGQRSSPVNGQTANLLRTDITYLSSVIDRLESVLAALMTDLDGAKSKSG